MRDQFGRFADKPYADPSTAPIRGARGRFAGRQSREPASPDDQLEPQRRYLISIEGQIGLLIASGLLVAMAFAVLAHP